MEAGTRRPSGLRVLFHPGVSCATGRGSGGGPTIGGGAAGLMSAGV